MPQVRDKNGSGLEWAWRDDEDSERMCHDDVSPVSAGMSTSLLERTESEVGFGHSQRASNERTTCQDTMSQIDR